MRLASTIHSDAPLRAAIDATMTCPIKNWDVPGEELGVDAIEERTIYALRRRFARIVRTDALVAELEALTEPAMA